jgi:N6-adenosine-specific RNA methylase IME4
MSEIAAHPLANLFPMLAEQEIRELADDIVTYGQRAPIMLLDGQVLDGRNRLAACRFAEVEPVFAQFEGDDPLGFVLSHNLHRRHLTASQRAMVAAKLVDWDIGLNQHTAGAANLQTHEAARRLSISERAVAAAKRIHEQGAPQLVDAIAGEALSELEHAAQLDVLRQEAKEIVAKAKEIRACHQRQRHAVRLAHMEMVRADGRATAPMALGKKFAVGYMDPPWQYAVRSEVTGREKSAENHYPTMPTDEIIALLRELDPFTDNAVVFCWATNPMLLDGLRVLAELGFTYVHHWVWDKEVAGTGYWGRDRHEVLLIGRRGDVAAPLPGTQPETVHSERKGRHSAKPDFYAEQIEKLFSGVARLELFSRRARPGWDHWGFETEQNPEAKASKDNGVTGPAIEVPADSMTGEVSRAHGPDHAGGTPPPIRRDGVERHAPSVTPEELAEYKLLLSVATGIKVSGPLFDSANEQGHIWAGKELTVGGARRLAALSRLVEVASEGDAVKPRGFNEALGDWSELNKLKARGGDLSPEEIARREALVPVVAADLAPVEEAPKPKRGRKAAAA